MYFYLRGLLDRYQLYKEFIMLKEFTIDVLWVLAITVLCSAICLVIVAAYCEINKILAQANIHIVKRYTCQKLFINDIVSYADTNTVVKIIATAKCWGEEPKTAYRGCCRSIPGDMLFLKIRDIKATSANSLLIRV